MKNAIKMILLISVFIPTFFILSACGDNNNVKNEQRYEISISIAYALAEEKGYVGTYEEFINAIKGESGIGIKSIVFESSKDNVDTYKINFTDNSYTTFSITNGNNGVDGKDGADGIGISAINKSASTIIDGKNQTKYTILYSNGKSFDYYVIDGKDGKSAFEIYKNYFEYTKTEYEWIVDLINGNLATVYHTISFDSNGGSPIESQTNIKHGEKASMTNIPTKNFYIFDGWYYEDENEIFKWLFNAYSVTDNLQLKAHWKAQEYPLQIKLNGGYFGSYKIPTTYTIDSNIELETPFNENKCVKFGGWFIDENLSTPLENFVFNGKPLNIYAKWDCVVNFEKQLFVYDGNEKVFDTTPYTNLPNGLTINWSGELSGQDAKEYTAVATLRDNNNNTYISNIVWEIAYANKLSESEWNSIFDNLHNSDKLSITAENSSFNIETEEIVTSSISCKKFNDLYELCLNGISVMNKSNDACDYYIYDEFILVTKLNTQLSSGMIYNNYYATINLLNALKQQFDFANFNEIANTYTITNAHLFNKTDDITENIILYFDANYDLFKISIRCTIEELEISNIVFSFDYNPTITNLDNLISSSFGHVTFDCNGGNYNITINETNNVNVLGYYVISNDNISLSYPPTKEGYNFVGWKYNDKLFDFENDEIVGEITLKAEWSPIIYNGTLHLEVVSNENNHLNESEMFEMLEGFLTSYNINDGIYNFTIETDEIIYDFTKEDEFTKIWLSWFDFSGFYDNPEYTGTSSKILKINKGTHNNTDYYCKFTEKNYNISYFDDNKQLEQTDNPTTMNLNSLICNTTAYDLNSIDKLGYTFVGWYDNPEFNGTQIGNVYNYLIANGNISGGRNLTIYAKFTPIDYTIVYILNNGTQNPNNLHSYNINSEATLYNARKDYYDFLGWYDNINFNGEPISKIEKGNTGNKTFYAKFEKHKYLITYNLNGGTNDSNNPNFHYYDSETFTLLSPTSENLKFDGWYENPDFSGSAITQIEKYTNRDFVLYAKFVTGGCLTINYYDIDTLSIISTSTPLNSLNNATIQLPLSIQFYKSENVVNLSQLTYDGYKFLYYTDDNDNSIYSSISELPAGTNGNKTLRAYFIKVAEDGYYEIYNVDNFNTLVTTPTLENQNCRLMQDIDFTNHTASRSIGSILNNYSYSGVFDGNHHIISNYNTSSNDICSGLFVCTNNATIKNLIVDNCQLNAYTYDYTFFYKINNPNITENVLAYRYIGGLVGYAINTTIENCCVVNTTITFGGYAFIGGLVGLSENTTIKNCYTEIKIMGYINDVSKYTKAICYIYDNGKFMCSNWVDKEEYITSEIGGLVGCLCNNSSIENCYSSGSINNHYSRSLASSSYYGYLGGIAGSSTDCSIKNTFSTVSINSGLEAFDDTDLTNKYNCYVGGFIGEMNFGTKINNCSAFGDITNTDSALTISEAGSTTSLWVANDNRILKNTGLLYGKVNSSDNIISNFYCYGKSNIKEKFSNETILIHYGTENEITSPDDLPNYFNKTAIYTNTFEVIELITANWDTNIWNLISIYIFSNDINIANPLFKEIGNISKVEVSNDFNIANNETPYQIPIIITYKDDTTTAENYNVLIEYGFGIIDENTCSIYFLYKGLYRVLLIYEICNE